MVDLFKPYGDVLACVIERDSNGISLGTSFIRFVIECFCFCDVVEKASIKGSVQITSEGVQSIHAVVKLDYKHSGIVEGTKKLPSTLKCDTGVSWLTTVGSNYACIKF